MAKITKATYWLVGALLVIAAVLGFAGSKIHQNQAGQNASSTAAAAPSSAETAPAPDSASAPQALARPTSGPAATAPSVSGYRITAPLAGDKWILGQGHLIQWNKAAGITGGIYLADAATGQTAGWINPSTGPNQTSYTWNTRDIALSRTDPSKKDIAVGTYILKVVFDRKPAIVIQSQPFSIIYSGQAAVSTYTVTLRNGSFSPASLAAHPGDKIVFVNADSVSYRILPNAIGSAYTLAAGGSVAVDLSGYAAGSYGYYSDAYPGMKFSFTVN